MSYDKKIRIQAVKYRENHTQAETEEAFGVSVSAIKDWQKLMKETGDLGNKPIKRSGRKIKEETLRADVEKYPDDFNSERAVRFGCTGEAIRLALKKLKITRKKRQ
jgi:transposase